MANEEINVADVMTAAQLIMGRSKAARQQALAAIAACKSEQPGLAATKLTGAVRIALYDSNAEFSNEECALFASAIAGGGPEVSQARTKVYPVRLSIEEYEEVQSRADSAGKSMAEFIREMIFGGS